MRVNHQTMSKNHELLFSDFSKVSREEWIEKATLDLKGKDVLELYTWELEPGISSPPYYDPSDITTLKDYDAFHNRLPRAEHTTQGARAWRNLQEIEVQNEGSSNQEAREALGNGVDGILFEISAPVNFGELLKDIPLDKFSVSFRLSSNDLSIAEGLHSFPGSTGMDTDHIVGSIEISGGSKEDQLKLFSLFQAWPGFKTLGVRSDVSSLTECVAELLQQTVEMMDAAQDNGNDLTETFRNMIITTPVGTSYFGEIAKIRALRRLVFQVAGAYGIDNLLPEDLMIRARSGKWINEAYEPHGNLLKSTTAAMAAILGGCNELLTEPEDQDALSVRMARNVSSILKDESFFNRSADPVAGSYYLESLTDNIARQSWDKFRKLLKKEMAS